MAMMSILSKSKGISQGCGHQNQSRYSGFQDSQCLLHAGVHYRLANFPTKLPLCQLTEDQMRMQYSLHKPLTAQQPLHDQLVSYKAWLSDEINTDRGSGPPAAESTAQNLMKVVHGFLGYQHYFIKPPKLSIWNILDGQSIAQYVSYHKHKGNTIGTLSAQIAGLRKALKFLKTQTEDGRIHKHIEAEIKWLSTLNSQLSHVMPKETPECKLPQAHQVVRAIENLRWKALCAMPTPGSVFSMQTARLFHDALLACMIFGHLPPIRLICLRTLQHPLARGCLHKGCKHKQCTGNRIHCLPTKQLQLHLSHFKVERK